MDLLHIVTKATPQADYRMRVEFDTGERGVFDCSYLLSDPFWKPLEDEKFFKKGHAECGTIVWDDVIDVAPESVWERTKFRK